MLGRNLISLTSMIFCFLRASFFFFCSSYLYLPKSRILQTGGSALGATSTRSRPASDAMVSASLRPTTPTMLPRSSTRRTRRTPISSLMRGPSRVGVKFTGGLAIYILLQWVELFRRDRVGPARRRRYRRLLCQSSNRFAERKGFLLLSAEPPQRNRSGCRLALPDDEQNRHLGKAVLADLIADLVVAGVGLDPEPQAGAFAHDLLGIGRRLGRNRRNHRLHRRQPQRETARIMLDQDADEALHRPQDRAVQHHRDMTRAILADIARAEPPRHCEIDLKGAALPLAAERVAQVKFELRPIEGTLARVERVAQPCGLDSVAQRRFGAIPDLVRAGANRRPIGQLDADLLEPEIAVDRQQQLAERDSFGRDLILRAEDVRV